ncbi:MAG: hypothetical protein Q4G26_14040 [Paracoccus sp. (in: a-proteobacteria)]|nr:hypothetical protein [Paracoccus sp. (in: a-proteobacteria)]
MAWLTLRGRASALHPPVRRRLACAPVRPARNAVRCRITAVGGGFLALATFCMTMGRH